MYKITDKIRHVRLRGRLLTAVVAAGVLVALGAVPASASGAGHPAMVSSGSNTLVAAELAASSSKPTTYTTPFGGKVTLYAPLAGTITNYVAADGSKITKIPTTMGLVVVTLAPPTASRVHGAAVRPDSANSCYLNGTKPVSDWCFTIDGSGTWVNNMINSCMNYSGQTLNIDCFIKFVPNGAIVADNYQMNVPNQTGFSVAWYPDWYVASGTYCGGATANNGDNSYLCLGVS